MDYLGKRCSAARTAWPRRKVVRQLQYSCLAALIYATRTKAALFYEPPAI